MSESERPSTPAKPEAVWKSIDGKEDASMENAFTADRLCAMARSREHEAIWSRRIWITLLTALACGFAYNGVSAGDPWVRLSQGWMLAWTCLLLWRVRRGPRRMSRTESCANFLGREFEDKRRGLLEIRRYLFLLIPPILVSWRAGGGHAMALQLRALGAGSSPRIFEFANGPWAFIVIGALLTLVWIAFGLAANRAARELEELRGRTRE